MEKTSLLEKPLSRKKFFQISAASGAGALLGVNLLEKASGLENSLRAGKEAEYPLNNPENIINTVCLQCNTGCALKVKSLDGLVVKIDGNPLQSLDNVAASTLQNFSFGICRG